MAPKKPTAKPKKKKGAKAAKFPAPTSLPKYTWSRVNQLLIAIASLRTRQRLSDFGRDLGWDSDKNLKRGLDAAQEAWIKHHGKDLFHIVDDEGQPWQQGTTSHQYIERISKDLLVDEVQSLYRRLASMIAVQAFQSVKNARLIHDEFSGVKTGVTKKLKISDQKKLEDFQRKFYAKIKGPINFETYDDLLNGIYTGLIENKKLQIQRQGSDNPPQVILPLCLISYNASLYLAVHFDSDPAIPRRIYTYEVTRLSEVTVLKEPFAYPLDFDPAAEFDSRFGLFNDKGNANHQVVLRIKSGSPTRHHLTERTWGPNQTVTDNPDGSTNLTFTANNLTEVIPFVLGYGKDVEALAPQSVRDTLREIIGDLKHLY